MAQVSSLSPNAVTLVVLYHTLWGHVLWNVWEGSTSNQAQIAKETPKTLHYIPVSVAYFRKQCKKSSKITISF